MDQTAHGPEIVSLPHPEVEELSDFDLEEVVGGDAKNLHLVFNAHESQGHG